MLRQIALATALIATVPMLAAAKDDKPEILKRSGKWVVEYDRDACHIYSQFGEGEAGVVARFTRYEPDDSFRLSIFGNRVRTRNVVEKVKIDFGLKGSPVTERVITGKAGETPALFFGSVRLDGWDFPSPTLPPPVTPEAEEKVTGVTIAMPRKPPFRLEAGSFGKPFGIMRHCLSNLVKSWGYDPDVQARLSRDPTPTESPAKWLSDSDYPKGAIAKGRNGIVQFRLDIDPEGKIAGCYILDRTEPDDFAATSCRVISRRAKFKPALDADHKPVRSYFVSSVRFLMAQ